MNKCRCVPTSGVSEGNPVPKQPPEDGTKGGVTDVLDQDILGVLDRHRANLPWSLPFILICRAYMDGVMG